MRPSSTPPTDSNTRPKWLAFVAALWMAGGACTTPKFGDGPSTDGASELDSDEAGAAAQARDASAASTRDADRDADADEAASELDAAASAATRDASGELLRDADRVEVDDSDASAVEVPDAGGSGAWIELGQYAMQVYAYGYDGALVTHARRVMLAEITRDGDAYQLVTTSCLDVASTSLATMAVRTPERLPPMRQRLLLEGETFSSEPIDKAEGFLPALPPGCADKLGQRVPKLPHQDWLADTCRCGGDLIPTRDDCRVLDPDDDENAGYTIEFRAINGSRVDLYAASLNESRLVEGGRRADGTLHALYDAKSGSLQYGCSPSGCADLSGPVAWCPAEFSSVELRPLVDDAMPAGGWSCEAILARESELLPALPPPWPPGGCNR